MFKNKYHSVMLYMMFRVTQSYDFQAKTLADGDSFEAFRRCKTTNLIVSRIIIKLSSGCTHIWVWISAKKKKCSSSESDDLCNDC